MTRLILPGSKRFEVTYSVDGRERTMIFRLDPDMLPATEQNLRFLANQTVNFKTMRSMKSFKMISYRELDETKES